MPELFLAATDAEIEATSEVMRQLRPAISAADYVARVRELQQSGYKLLCLRDDGRVAAVAGFRLSESLSWGRFVYIDDLVCDENVRSSGYGSRLLAWIADYGRQHGCRELHLDSGVQRFDAHRFYLRERMDITCHHFRMAL